MTALTIWQRAASQAMSPPISVRTTIPIPRKFVDRLLADGLAVADDQGIAWYSGFPIEACDGGQTGPVLAESERAGMSITAEISARMADGLARKKDQLIADALKRHLGVEVLDINSLAGRLECVARVGVEGEQYQVDGVPILWVGDARLERDGSVMTADFDYAQIVPRPDPL